MSTYEDDHNVQSNEPDLRGTEPLPEGLEDILNQFAGGHGGNERARTSWIAELPSLELSSLDQHDSCPVCMTTYSALLAAEEHGRAMDSPAYTTENLGAIRLPCKHTLCRQCAGKWLAKNNSCPNCRTKCDPSPVKPGQGLFDFANIGQGAPEGQTVEETFRHLFAGSSSIPTPRPPRPGREEYSMYS